MNAKAFKKEEKTLQRKLAMIPNAQKKEK